MNIYIKTAILGLTLLVNQPAFSQSSAAGNSAGSRDYGNTTQQLRTLKTVIEGLNQGLLDKMDQLKTDLTNEMNTLKQDLSDRMDSIEASVDEINDTKLPALQQNIDDLEQNLTDQIDVVDGKVDDLTGDVEIIDNTVSDISILQTRDLSCAQYGKFYDQANRRCIDATTGGNVSLNSNGEPDPNSSGGNSVGDAVSTVANDMNEYIAQQIYPALNSVLTCGANGRSSNGTSCVSPNQQGMPFARGSCANGIRAIWGDGSLQCILNAGEGDVADVSTDNSCAAFSQSVSAVSVPGYSDYTLSATLNVSFPVASSGEWKSVSRVIPATIRGESFPVTATFLAWCDKSGSGKYNISSIKGAADYKYADGRTTQSTGTCSSNAVLCNVQMSPGGPIAFE